MTAIQVYMLFGIPILLLALGAGAYVMTDRDARRHDRQHEAGRRRVRAILRATTFLT